MIIHRNKLYQILGIRIMKVLKFTDLKLIYYDLTFKIIKEMMEKHGINYEEFLTIVTENNGCVTGSFIYYAVCQAFGINCDFHYKNINVLVYTNVKDNYVNNIEPYLMENRFWHIVTLKKYKHANTVYGTIYSLMDSSGIKLNFYLVDKPVKKIIFEDYNIDCCKIIHTKNHTQIYNVDNFIMQKCNARFHTELVNYRKDNYYYDAEYGWLFDYHHYSHEFTYSNLWNIYNLINIYLPNIDIYLSKDAYETRYTEEGIINRMRIGHMIKIIKKSKNTRKGECRK